MSLNHFLKKLLLPTPIGASYFTKFKRVCNYAYPNRLLDRAGKSADSNLITINRICFFFFHKMCCYLIMFCYFLDAFSVLGIVCMCVSCALGVAGVNFKPSFLMLSSSHIRFLLQSVTASLVTKMPF